MMKIWTIAAALVFGLLPTTSMAWISSNGLVVQSTGPDTFTVPFRGMSGPRAFWCAAGDYVVRELNLPRTTKIYRTSSVPRRGGQPMTFSVNATDARYETGLSILNSPRGISASFAGLQCEDRAFPDR